MTDLTQEQKRRLTAALVLIVLGISLFVFQNVEGATETFVFLLAGALFVAAYVYWRVYGLLIPGGILLGLALGSIGGEIRLGAGDFGAIGLGIGFIAIYLIHLGYRRESIWWPLVPGGVLIIGGIASSDPTLAHYISEGWPLILVLAGLILLVLTYRARRA
ncbi:MAG: hypothetical protein GF355_16020 [Candidatus Eisenbacteria bacterium]|nr:hypothetical protein [Candidatus Eisenbacteria bacterium]